MITKHADITEKIIKAFYIVYNRLGYGFLEKVYGQAMVIELQKMGLDAALEVRIPVYYDEQLIGEYIADLIVVGKVIVELKAARLLVSEFEAQLLNYLKATRYEVGLILNFGPRPDTRRKVYDNERKGNFSWENAASSKVS